MATPTELAVEQLLKVAPAFHREGTVNWNAGRELLAVLARKLAAGARTIETGSGASTVVFAAGGTRHTAISPDASEHERVAKHCIDHGIDSGGIEFLADISEHALANLSDPAGSVDLILVDGKHAFPTPVVDFQHAWRLLRRGGLLLLDDLPIPSVQLVHQFCCESPHWEMVELVGTQAGAYRKLDDEPPRDYWSQQSMNSSYPDFGHLPVADRLRLRARRRLRSVRERLA